MKTERMTLLVTPDEKALINARALAMGVSASEFVRRAVTLLDHEDIAALEEIQILLPAFNAAIDNMQKTVAATNARSEEHERVMAHHRSAEYRAQVRHEVANDPAIDWDGVNAIFGGAGRPTAADVAA